MDKLRYRLEMKAVLERQARLDIKQALIERLLVEDAPCLRCSDADGRDISGTGCGGEHRDVLRGVIHIGLKQFPAGRARRASGQWPPEDYARLGFPLGRLKTGTLPAPGRSHHQF